MYWIFISYRFGAMLIFCCVQIIHQRMLHNESQSLTALSFSHYLHPSHVPADLPVVFTLLTQIVYLDSQTDASL